MRRTEIIPGCEHFVVLFEGIPWTFRAFISRTAFSEHEIKFYTMTKDKEYKGYLCAHVSVRKILVSERNAFCFVSVSIAYRGLHFWECYGTPVAESYIEL